MSRSMGSGIKLGLFASPAAGVLALLFLMISFADAAPANDNYADRIVISGVSNVISGTLRGATYELPPAVMGDYGPRSVWWSWTAPADGQLTVQLVGCSSNGVSDVFAVVRPVGTVSTRRFFFSWPADRLFSTWRVQAGITYDIAVMGSSEIEFTLEVIAHSGPLIMRDLPPRRFVEPGKTEVLSLLVGFLATNWVDGRPPGGPLPTIMPWNMQWMRNGQELPGRTNLCLIITNATPADAGIYTVAVWDSQGTNISSPCQLDVETVPPDEQGRLSVVRTGSGNLALSLESFRRAARLVSSSNLVDWSGENTIGGLIGTGSVFTPSADGSPVVVPLSSGASGKFFKVQRYAPTNDFCNALLRALRAAQIQYHREWTKRGSSTVTLSDLTPYLGDYPNIFPTFRCPAGGIVMVGLCSENPFCYGGHAGGVLEVPD